IVSSRLAGLIATWIDRKDPNEDPYTVSDTPFLFRHVFRMNDQTTFFQDNHKYYNKSSKRILPTVKCHHGPSIMIMKFKGSEKIIGAYNPINWKQDIEKKVYIPTSESFLFSCDDKYGTNHRLSRVRDFEHAICLESVRPSGNLLKFGEDLVFHYYSSGSIHCDVKNKFYEQPIILKEGYYLIEKLDIFAIGRKDDEPMMVMNKEVNYVNYEIPSKPITKMIESDFFELIATWIKGKDPVNSRYTESNMPVISNDEMPSRTLSDDHETSNRKDNW
ncbi:12245_t:CDS:2, partial [Funneliformis mosseae]